MPTVHGQKVNSLLAHGQNEAPCPCECESLGNATTRRHEEHASDNLVMVWLLLAARELQDHREKGNTNATKDSRTVQNNSNVPESSSDS